MDCRPAYAKDSSFTFALATPQGVQRPPYHLLHGPSPLNHSATYVPEEDTVIIAHARRPPRRPPSWPGAVKRYEGPATKNLRYRAPPPHLSIFQADSRERIAFQQGLLPPYAKHLATPAISPVGKEETQWALMEIDEAGEEEQKRVAATYPNWYRTPTSPKSRRTILPPQMTVSEAGLRLRLIRIASACSLFPQLGAHMQDLLHKEIRAAMYREELSLLSHFDAKERRTSKSLPDVSNRSTRGTKRGLESEDRPPSPEGLRKKLRMAAASVPRPRPLVAQTVEEILCVQPDRDPPYSSDFMDEDEILERAWMESMTRRNHRTDLRKNLLLQSILDCVSDASASPSRWAPFPLLFSL